MWILTRPGLRRGVHSLSWALDSCTDGCPIFGPSGPERVFELDGAPPLSGVADLMPARMRTPEQCQALLAAWWQERLAAFSFENWSVENCEKWREAQI